ncbi:translation initiation factor IF-2, partial [Streptomyces sp. BvitLS-983]
MAPGTRVADDRIGHRPHGGGGGPVSCVRAAGVLAAAAGVPPGGRRLPCPGGAGRSARTAPAAGRPPRRTASYRSSRPRPASRPQSQSVAEPGPVQRHLREGPGPGPPPSQLPRPTIPTAALRRTHGPAQRPGRPGRSGEIPAEAEDPRAGRPRGPGRSSPVRRHHSSWSTSQTGPARATPAPCGTPVPGLPAAPPRPRPGAGRPSSRARPMAARRGCRPTPGSTHLRRRGRLADRPQSPRRAPAAAPRTPRPPGRPG